MPVVERWHDFFGMTGGATAALVGLLFTTMALRSDRAGEASYEVESDLWIAASVPLACFLDILLLSVAFLVPDQSALGLGLPMLALAVLGAAQLLWVLMRSWTVPALRPRRIMLPVLVCYLAQAVVAVVEVGGHSELLWILAIVIGGLILSAALSAWTLLREPILQRARRSAAPQPTAQRQISDVDRDRLPHDDVAPE